jgi:hypothetical protein
VRSLWARCVRAWRAGGYAQRCVPATESIATCMCPSRCKIVPETIRYRLPASSTLRGSDALDLCSQRLTAPRLRGGEGHRYVAGCRTSEGRLRQGRLRKPPGWGAPRKHGGSTLHARRCRRCQRCRAAHFDRGRRNQEREKPGALDGLNNRGGVARARALRGATGQASGRTQSRACEDPPRPRDHDNSLSRYHIRFGRSNASAFPILRIKLANGDALDLNAVRDWP